MPAQKDNAIAAAPIVPECMEMVTPTGLEPVFSP